MSNASKPGACPGDPRCTCRGGQYEGNCPRHGDDPRPSEASPPCFCGQKDGRHDYQCSAHPRHRTNDARARLDADGTAKPLTEIVGVFPAGEKNFYSNAESLIARPTAERPRFDVAKSGRTTSARPNGANPCPECKQPRGTGFEHAKDCSHRPNVLGETWAKGFRAGEDQAAETLGEHGHHDAARFLRAHAAKERSLEQRPEPAVPDLRSALRSLIRGTDGAHMQECTVFVNDEHECSCGATNARDDARHILHGLTPEPRRESAVQDELAPLRARMAKGRKKYPNGCTVTSLQDEAGEVTHAINKYETEERVRDELLDVAGVAMRLYLGEIDRGLTIDGLVQRRTDGSSPSSGGGPKESK